MLKINDYWFEWNGVRSDELAGQSSDTLVDSWNYHLAVSKAINIPVAARKVTTFKVPGRSGDIIVPQDAWDNTTLEIEIFIWSKEPESERNLHRFCRVIAEWLYGGSGGYNTLRLYNSDGYYEAAFSGPYNVENELYKCGRATLRFNMSPRHYIDEDLTIHTDDIGQMSSSYGTFWEVDERNDTAHVAWPRIIIQQPVISSYGTDQVYPFELLVKDNADELYRLRCDFLGRAYPAGNTNFKYVAIDSEMERVYVTNGFLTGGHARSTGVASASRFVATEKVGAPNNSDFPALVVTDQGMSIAVRYFKENNGTRTYYTSARPLGILVEGRRWTL